MKRGRNNDKFAIMGGPILTDEQRACVRGVWDEICGPMRQTGRHGIIPIFERVPHLAASLESLVEQGYSGPHIAEMFGVADSAVYFWARKAGIKIPRRVGWGRIWSDELNQFVPVPGHVVDALPHPVRPKSLRQSEALKRHWERLSPEDRAARREQLARVRNPAKAHAVYVESGVGCRTEGKARYRARAEARTACRKGHPWTGENQYIHSKTGYAECRTCRRDANRRAVAKSKAVA